LAAAKAGIHIVPIGLRVNCFRGAYSDPFLVFRRYWSNQSAKSFSSSVIFGQP